MVAESLLPWPSVEIEDGETLLGQAEVEALSCTGKIRELAAQEPGIDMTSERVTAHPQFGHIYRYQTAEIENIPQVGKRMFRTSFIVWTLDRRKWSLASIPLPSVAVQ